MNDTILKIALDEYLINYVDNETPRRYFIDGNADVEEVVNFAISIIKQCITIAEYPQLNDDQAYYGKLFADYIRKHFNLS